MTATFKLKIVAQQCGQRRMNAAVRGYEQRHWTGKTCLHCSSRGGALSCMGNQTEHRESLKLCPIPALNQAQNRQSLKLCPIPALNQTQNCESLKLCPIPVLNQTQ